MTRFRIWAGLVLTAAVLLGGLTAWWATDLRWRPRTVKAHQAEIARLLDSAGWVSSGRTGPKLYMLSFHACPDCARFMAEEVPKLDAAGVDTRVIMIARADVNGLSRSSPVERATVAELWVGRRWALLGAWTQAAPDAWTAPGIPPADGDLARTAVVEAGRKLVADLRPLLRANGVRLAYPTLVWWTKDGVMRACACERRESYRYLRRELGAES
jgi:hypothetical protein